MSLDSQKLLDEVNGKRPFPIANIIAFIVISGVLGWSLPAHGGVRLLAFALVCIWFLKSLQK